ncbi:hypothetical protein [Streptomyces sp. B3I8]|uniref:hypothetical protein n=1 Tax=Streptomyces sp. B3I8 TaxID=3042303 RepID=UPI002783E4BA|nr:hypothetical protein [Streptomyces sp. B3I8]MDQ0788822.1 amino acid transporter [Streptomyces sp. B3I8]
MLRRPVALVAAVVLFCEAVGIAVLNWSLGTLVDRQHMSLAGLDPKDMSASSKIGGLVFGLYFVLCGIAALAVCLRNRPSAGLGRVLLISAAVVHAVLGAFAVGLIGWRAFAYMMVVLALIVLTLMTYDREDGTRGADPVPSDAPESPAAPEFPDSPAAPDSPADAPPAGNGSVSARGAPTTP